MFLTRGYASALPGYYRTPLPGFQNEALRDLPSMCTFTSIRAPSYLSFLFLLTYLVTNARSVRIMERGVLDRNQNPLHTR